MASFAQVEPMPRYPILLAVLSAALFGAATPASKWLLTGLSPFQLAGLLYLGAAAGVAPAAMRQKGGVRLLLRTDHCNRAGTVLKRCRGLSAVVFDPDVLESGHTEQQFEVGLRIVGTPGQAITTAITRI